MEAKTERGLRFVNNIIFSSIESAKRFFKQSREYQDCAIVYDTAINPGMVTAHVFNEVEFFIEDKEN